LTTKITIIDNKNDLRIILLRRARFIELDTRFLCIKPPAAGDLPTVEVLSISGNIVDLRAFFNRWTRLRVLGVTSRRAGTHSLDTGLAALEAAAALGLLVSRLGIEFSDDFKFKNINQTHNIDGPCFASLLRTATRISPQELVFNNDFYEHTNTELLCFRSARSIEMSLYPVCFMQLPDGDFPIHERARGY
jgi:hypothetical protein